MEYVLISCLCPFKLFALSKTSYFAFWNTAQGGSGLHPPYLESVFPCKNLVIDIFTIPFVRIRGILFAIRISNKIWRLFFG